MMNRQIRLEKIIGTLKCVATCGAIAEGRSPLFYHESWQNDICSFRAMTIALIVSFKLISF